MKPTCPECGGNDIVENNDCLATYPVTEVAADGEPTAYGEPTIHHTEVVDGIDRYQCGDCRFEFNDFDHQLEETPA